jgi:hypothetical protein
MSSVGSDLRLQSLLYSKIDHRTHYYITIRVIMCSIRGDSCQYGLLVQIVETLRFNVESLSSSMPLYS